jgi:hypothetical protein
MDLALILIAAAWLVGTVMGKLAAARERAELGR